MKRIVLTLAAVLACTAALADPLWIDVRSPEEYKAGHIEGDPNLPYEEIAKTIETVAPDKSQEIVLYCERGGRSGVAKLTLGRLGYTNVRNAGGIGDARKERGLE